MEYGIMVEDNDYSDVIMKKVLNEVVRSTIDEEEGNLPRVHYNDNELAIIPMLMSKKKAIEPDLIPSRSLKLSTTALGRNLETHTIRSLVVYRRVSTFPFFI